MTIERYLVIKKPLNSLKITTKLIKSILNLNLIFNIANRNKNKFQKRKHTFYLVHFSCMDGARILFKKWICSRRISNALFV